MMPLSALSGFRRIVGAVAIICWLVPAALEAHLHLLRSTPADGLALSVPPTQVRLWFSEDPLLPLTRLTLDGPQGAVRLEPVKAASDRSVIANLPLSLPAGRYRVAWRTAGDDGHLVQGELTFTVAAARLPSL